MLASPCNLCPFYNPLNLNLNPKRYTDNPPPDPANTLADYIEPTGGGYAPIVIPNEGGQRPITPTIEMPPPQEIAATLLCTIHFDGNPGYRVWICKESGEYRITAIGAGGHAANEGHLIRGGDGGGFAEITLYLTAGESYTYSVGSPDELGAVTRWSTILHATSGVSGNLPPAPGEGFGGTLNHVGDQGGADGRGGASGYQISSGIYEANISRIGMGGNANQGDSCPGGSGAIIVEKGYSPSRDTPGEEEPVCPEL